MLGLQKLRVHHLLLFRYREVLNNSLKAVWMVFVFLHVSSVKFNTTAATTDLPRHVFVLFNESLSQLACPVHHPHIRQPGDCCWRCTGHPRERCEQTGKGWSNHQIDHVRHIFSAS